MSVRGLVLLGAGAAVLGVVIAQAWVSDDAFITFRVIDNFVNGHGLRWNVDERVEVTQIHQLKTIYARILQDYFAKA